MATDLVLSHQSATSSQYTSNKMVPTAHTKTTISHHPVTILQQNQQLTKTNWSSRKTRTKLFSRLLSMDHQASRPIRTTAGAIHSPHPCHKAIRLDKQPQLARPTFLRIRRRGGRENKAQRNGFVSGYQDISQASRHRNTSKLSRGTNPLIAVDVESLLSVAATNKCWWQILSAYSPLYEACMCYE